MKSIKQFSCILFCLIGSLFPFVSFAAPQIQLEADTNSVAIDEALQLYITIEQENTSGNVRLSTPEISGLDHFQVVGRSSSTNMQIINGIGTAILEQQLQVIPQKEGTFTIGPVEAEYGGEFVQSNTIEVSVIPSPTKTLKQSLLEDTAKDEVKIAEKAENTQETSTSAPSIQPLNESINVSHFSGTNWWFWSVIIALMVTLGGGIWIGKNLAKRS